MPGYRDARPWEARTRFIAHVGLETDLIFNHGIDLPGFASFPLLDAADTRALLKKCSAAIARLARQHHAGAILETPTWMANRDRAAPLGYKPRDLRRLNRDAVALMREVRAEEGDLPTVISGNAGPRRDAYAPGEQMSVAEARDYHAEQIGWLDEAGADLVSIYTVAYPAEAAGFARAAKDRGIACVVSFTVETDGNLPDGTPPDRAVELVEAESGHHPDHYMLNCAHPDHFARSLPRGRWQDRLAGFVVNASRKSHAELDESETLDAGDPDLLGQQVADLRRLYPAVRVIGGCCGTDLRHLERMLKETEPAEA